MADLGKRIGRPFTAPEPIPMPQFAPAPKRVETTTPERELVPLTPRKEN